VETRKAGASAKTFSFAVLHFSVAFSVAYLITGDVLIGGLLALVEPAINTVAFYFHELAWRRIESSGDKAFPGTLLGKVTVLIRRGKIVAGLRRQNSSEAVTA
jgi:uncharacterized membrane protein